MDDSGAESLGTQENPVSVDLRLARKHASVLKRDDFSDEDPGAAVSGDDDLEITVGARKRRRSESPSVGDVSPGSSSGADAVDHVPRKRWNARSKIRNVNNQDGSRDAGDSPDSSTSSHVPKAEEAITIKCEPWSPDDAANSASSDGGGSHDAEKETRIESRPNSGIRKFPGGSSSRSASPRSRSPKDSTGSATPPNGVIPPFDYQRLAVGMVPLMGLPQLNRGFVCEPCGIRFSSPGTLQAHQTHYCAARKDNDASQPEEKKVSRPSMADSPSLNLNAFGKPGVASPPIFVRPDPAVVIASCSPQPAPSPTPEAASVTTAKPLKCPLCPFLADKKPLLAKHMKSHSSSDSETPDENQLSNGADRYCHDCGIQFSSASTYRVHRKHYCQGRRNTASAGPSPEVATPLASAFLPPPLGIPPLAGATSVTDDRTPCVILPTNPLLVIPYPVLQCARFVPLGAIPPECLVIGADGTLTTRSNQIAAFSANATQPIPAVSPRGQPRRSRNQSPEATTAFRLSPGKLSPKARTSNPPHKAPGASNGIEPELVKNGQAGDKSVMRPSSSPRPESPLDLSRQDQSPPLVRIKSEPEEDLRQRPRASQMPTRTTNFRRQDEEGNPEENHGAKVALPPGIEVTRAKDGKGRNSGMETGGTRGISPGVNQSQLPLPAGIPPGLLLPGSIPFPAAIQEMMSAELLSSAAAVFGQVPAGPGMQQPYVVKKGVSKCSECNIVFYKRENYLIHKKHYCASRQLSDQEDQQPSPVLTAKSASAQDVKASTSSSPSHDSSLQFVCNACGTKFSSTDTLLAHQSFYCVKIHQQIQQAEVKKVTQQASEVQQCPACLGTLPHGLSLEDHIPSCNAMKGGTNALQQVWQCPCCEFMTTSIPVAQCHLERHAGLQAFRCLLCGYKGNTLRGMRIHIRMHFDPKQTDIPEESIISYIVAGEVELPSGGLLAGLVPDNASAKPYRNDSSSDESSRGKPSPASRPAICSKMDRTGKKNGASGSDSREGSPDVNDNQTFSSASADGASVVDAMESSQHHGDNQLDRRPQKKFCKTCKVSFSHLSSFIQHKKLHCPSKTEKTSVSADGAE